MGDSEFGVTRFLVSLDQELVQGRSSRLGLGLSYSIADYTFSGPGSDVWSDPWGEVHSSGLGLDLLLRTDSRWAAFFAATLDWSWEEGADLGEAVTFGLIGSASYAFRYDRRLGLGLGFFEGLEESRVFPFVMIDWRITDRLSLSNPLRVGPAGPAGLELVFEASERWRIGGGGAYRSFRFRLGEDGPAPGGLGETEGLPAWLRLSYLAGASFQVNMYAGAVFNGELTLEDENGRRLATEPYDTAPLAALTLDMEF